MIESPEARAARYVLGDQDTIGDHVHVKRLLADVSQLKKDVGAPAIEKPGYETIPGTGFALAFANVDTRLDEISVNVAKLTTSIDADRKAREDEKAAALASLKERRAPIAWGAKIAIGALITALVIAVVGLIRDNLEINWRSRAAPSAREQIGK